MHPVIGRARGRRALVRDLHSEVFYETQFAHPVPGCTRRDVGVLEAAVDLAFEHSERSVVDHGCAAGRFVNDATGFRRDDAPGLEHGNAASRRLELDDAASPSFGQ